MLQEILGSISGVRQFSDCKQKAVNQSKTLKNLKIYLEICMHISNSNDARLNCIIPTFALGRSDDLSKLHLSLYC